MENGMERNNKSKICVICFCVIIFLLLFALNHVNNKNQKLEDELQYYRDNQTAEEIILPLPCPICGSDVSLLPVNNSFYIKCNKCKLQTGYFDSKKEILEYWNNRKDISNQL